MAITSKLYRCSNCNHERKLETNHANACYPICPKCRKQSQHVCLEVAAIAAAKSAPFTKVKIVSFEGSQLASVEAMLGRKVRPTLYSQRHEFEAGETLVKTSYLFGDQFDVHIDSPINANRRLFDFVGFLDRDNKKVTHGYYITDAEGLNILRGKRHQCGYCGSQDEIESVCTSCIDSPYLEENNMHLLIKVPVNQKRPEELNEMQVERIISLWDEREERRKAKLVK